jgi:hypothetical protein
MTSYTPLLHLPEVASNQDQKEATINTAIAILEAAMNDTLTVSLASGDVTLNTDQFTKYFHHQFSGNTVARTVRSRTRRAGSPSRTWAAPPSPSRSPAHPD